MTETIQAAPTILRRKQVEARTGLSRSSLYLRMSEGTFPKPICLGEGPTARAVGWPSNWIDQWIGERIAASRKAK